MEAMSGILNSVNLARVMIGKRPVPAGSEPRRERSGCSPAERNRTQVDADLLARAPALRVVGRLGVGLDNIDMAACKARGITVFPATGATALGVGV